MHTYLGRHHCLTSPRPQNSRTWNFGYANRRLGGSTRRSIPLLPKTFDKSLFAFPMSAFPTSFLTWSMKGLVRNGKTSTICWSSYGPHVQSAQCSPMRRWKEGSVPEYRYQSCFQSSRAGVFLTRSERRQRSERERCWDIGFSDFHISIISVRDVLW